MYPYIQKKETCKLGQDALMGHDQTEGGCASRWGLPEVELETEMGGWWATEPQLGWSLGAGQTQTGPAFSLLGRAQAGEETASPPPAEAAMAPSHLPRNWCKSLPTPVGTGSPGSCTAPVEVLRFPLAPTEAAGGYCARYCAMGY